MADNANDGITPEYSFTVGDGFELPSNTADGEGRPNRDVSPISYHYFIMVEEYEVKRAEVKESCTNDENQLGGETNTTRVEGSSKTDWSNMKLEPFPTDKDGDDLVYMDDSDHEENVLKLKVLASNFKRGNTISPSNVTNDGQGSDNSYMKPRKLSFTPVNVCKKENNIDSAKKYTPRKRKGTNETNVKGSTPSDKMVISASRGSSGQPKVVAKPLC
ncbi:hypothetical protein SESBI_40952 [Sesbania bispinosa]|nr:hypothetical protein SESBI_40952 [Sesbania bispinosa]